MKLTQVKRMMAKGLAAGLLTGAALAAAPAGAQAVRFGVQIGVPVRSGPVHVQPGPYVPAYTPAPAYPPGFWARREAFMRHEECRREHEFHRNFYGR